MSTTTETILQSRQSTLPRPRPAEDAATDGQHEFPLTLDQHRHGMQRLAARHVVGRGGRDRLRLRLRVAEKLLREFQRRLLRGAGQGGSVSPAVFAMLENFSLIEEHIELARQELARPYRLPLPQLVAGASEGLPRIYDVAQELIVHSDGQLDGELIQEVVVSYQSRAALMLRELWAVPAMLRLALLEHLSRVAVLLSREPTSTDRVRLSVSISNGIGALRALGSLDWREFVEQQSVVEAILRRDPLGIYPQMSPKSRDCYRKAIEVLARRSPLDEAQVATAVVELARVGHGSHDAAARGVAGHRRGVLVGEGMKERHVGFYLIDRGRRMLEERIGYRPGRWERVVRAAGNSPLACYLGGIGTTWLALMTIAVFAGIGAGIVSLAGVATSALLAILFAGAATECSVRIVNCICTMFVKTRPIMRLDFSKGIPDDCRTLVAVPTMLASKQAVGDLAADLEVRYLANRDDNLCFALVTDFPDAASETLPGDAALLELARREIEQLNTRYGDGSGPFYLLHRSRKWNEREQKWMGEERKRGKLGALNRLLRGDDAEFGVAVGEIELLTSVRYVITLDTDTQLPRDTARELVAAMSHPLNRPRIDKLARIVMEGHAILQPRVATTMPEARRSVFAQLFAGDAGVDPYTQQTSDVYQDVFGEGSYIGKGIYDVDAVETVFHERFPNNRVLSHDLIEGCFARSGLINDVELFEGFPARLPADMSRRHRWIRGDWQIADWLRGRVPTAAGDSANPLPALARWKIFDNLRRSLTPVFLLGFLFAACLAVPALAGTCLLLAIAAGLIPDLLAMLPGLFGKPPEKPWRLHLSHRAADCRKLLAREAIGWAMLPYTVASNLDAVVRALYRLHVSHRKLLEWTVSSEAERNCVRDRRGYYRLLWVCPASGIAAVAWLVFASPAAVLAVIPLLLAWIVAPSIAWRISFARQLDAVRLNKLEQRNVRRWARRTWHFFDTFVSKDSNWLPPDNVQFDEQSIVAPRTSPTNIGLGMLADLSACDLGYLPVSRLLERTGRTLQTMLKLETHRGHLYNWYDTRTLEPLGARYISTVDSGNLRGALLVMQAAMAELRDRPLVGPRFVHGFQDTLDVIADLAGMSEGKRPKITEPATGVCAAMQCIDSVAALAAEMHATADRGEVREWIAALMRQCNATREELSRLAFWLGDDSGAKLTSALAGLAVPEAEAGEALRLAAADLLALVIRADKECTLRSLPRLAEEMTCRAGRVAEMIAIGPLAAELAALLHRAEQAAWAAREQLAEINSLGETCRDFSVMDFRFLYNVERKLLAVGYNVGEHRLDASCYDLLASEARLASFLAVSDGQLPMDHWAALGRGVALHGGVPTLMSWSGSMFEYLMPMLIMPSHPTTLLDASCRSAVRRHIGHAREQGLPWGVSESCYDQRNDDGAYSYRAFGVPGLRLERRTDQTVVIAPYASALAAMVAPRAACENLARIEAAGAICSYGFYDAVDYTSAHLSGQSAPCRTVMAHHSGMALVALASILLDAPMRRRLMADPRLRAHDLLLQQRMPQTVRPVDWRKREAAGGLMARLEGAAPAVRVIDAPHSAKEQLHVLGDDDYQLHLTAAGSVEQCCYLRDLSTGRFWSNTYHPMRRQADRHRALFAPGRAEFRAVSKQIDARTLVAVSSEQGLEVRRIKLSNLSRDERTIELTTYAEIGRAAQVEAVSGGGALLACWPPRSSGEPAEWRFHLVRAIDAEATPAGFETSRERFIGAGRTLAAPAALQEPGDLSSIAGTARDAILSLRQTLTLAAEESVEIDIITGIAATRDHALAAIQRHRDPRLTWRVFEMADAAAQAVST